MKSSLFLSSRYFLMTEMEFLERGRFNVVLFVFFILTRISFFTKPDSFRTSKPSNSEVGSTKHQIHSQIQKQFVKFISLHQFSQCDYLFSERVFTSHESFSIMQRNIFILTTLVILSSVFSESSFIAVFAMDEREMTTNIIIE